MFVACVVVCVDCDVCCAFVRLMRFVDGVCSVHFVCVACVVHVVFSDCDCALKRCM